MKIKVVYSPKVVSESGSKISPSGMKPKLMAEYLQTYYDLTVEFVEPVAVTREDILRCHGQAYVDGILTLRRKNGFGTISQSVVDSLPHTNGAMYQATKLALETREPTCALVSGFHHAGYDGFEGLGYFCTFNGLMIAATKLVEEGDAQRIAIVDCDMHWGNGTDDIADKLDPHCQKYLNISFGKVFGTESSGKDYLKHFDMAKAYLERFRPIWSGRSRERSIRRHLN